jgi:SAM-dependent methyltransferase
VTLSGRFANQLAPTSGLSKGLLGQMMDAANAYPMQLAIAALKPKRGERILDAGCGTGAALALARAAADCQLYGTDSSEDMISVARKRLGADATLACGAIEDRLHLDWQPFDGILALNMLYFAAPDGAMAGALREALRPGGRLVAYVTHRQGSERWRLSDAGRHQLFDASDLEDALMQGGFAPESISIVQQDVAPGMRGLIARAER